MVSGVALPRFMKLAGLALLLAALLVAGFVLPADAGPKSGCTAVGEAQVTLEQTDDLLNGKVIDWECTDRPTTQLKFNLAPDDLDGSIDDGSDSTTEWELIGRTGPCEDVTATGGSGYTLFHEFFLNDPTYGPRINKFFPGSYEMVPVLGSIALIHDGPTPTHHAVHQGYSGRHLVACVDT